MTASPRPPPPRALRSGSRSSRSIARSPPPPPPPPPCSPALGSLTRGTCSDRASAGPGELSAATATFHEHYAIERDLAKELVARYYDEDLAFKAEEAFDQIFVKKSIPEDISVFDLDGDNGILDILLSGMLIDSKAEGKRLIGQNAIKINGEVCADPNYIVSKGCGELIVKIGKRRFLKIVG